MRKLFIMFIGTCIVVGANAQTTQTIKLNAPDKSKGEVTMQAFEKRQSTREFADRKLSMQDLSDLVWAANGFNRPVDQKRTAPTVMNKQEIDLYVILEEGAYIYDAKSHELRLIVAEDLRVHVAGTQPYVKTAPVCLLIVADLNLVGGVNDNTKVWTAYDAGIVSQNISLFCAGCGFATVPRAFMDKDALAKALKLDDSYMLHLNHPVGYFK